MTTVSKALVVGSGAIGLRTAIELLKKNIQVVVQSATSPLDKSNASWGSGGKWMPTYCSDPRVDRWSIETLDELLLNKSHCEITPVVNLRTTNDLTENTIPEWSKDSRLNFQHMNVEMLEWQNRVHKLRFPFTNYKDLVKHGYHYCWLFDSPIVDAPKYLQAMVDEIQERSQQIQSSSPSRSGSTEEQIFQRKKFTDLQQVVASAKNLGCDAVFNCTGVGALQLCNDTKMVPGRGIILQYNRNCARLPFLEVDPDLKDVSITISEPPFSSNTEPCYLIPRGDVLLVGGSYQEGDTEPTIRPEERNRLIMNAQLLGIDTTRATPIEEWVGFRPIRPTIRVEVDDSGIGQAEGVKVIHNYGSGGSGWTVFVGQSKEAVSLL